MPIPYQLISSNIQLHSQLRAAIGPFDPVAYDAKAAAASADVATPSDKLLVLDAQLPQEANFPPDLSEETSLALLRDLRDRGIDRPVLVIRSNLTAMSELEQYCSPENRAIALPLRHAQPDNVEAFAAMLRDPENPPNPTWKVIEIEVNGDRVTCYLCDRNGKTIKWGEGMPGYHQVLNFALEFDNPEFAPGWAFRFHVAGSALFNSLVVQTLGRGLFAHLERAAGGLNELAFRFRVDDPNLYSAPFEAAVRVVSGQQYSRTAQDYAQQPFILVNAPITRRMKGAILRTTTPTQGLPRPAKLLFIRSQVGEHPEGQTEVVTVRVPELGRSRPQGLDFRRLANIDRELGDLQDIAARYADNLSVEAIDLSRVCGEAGGVDAKTALLGKLKDNRYDVVHFAGHSLTANDGLTRLVLPGSKPGEGEALEVEKFAEPVAQAGTRLVYLSSCQGNSANTVASLAQRGVPHVLGFRWVVEDDRAAEFAALFYAALFGSKSATICASFRAACNGVYQPQEIETSPIWASPILAMRSDDWMVQRVL